MSFPGHVMTGVMEILELIFFIMMMTNDLEHQIEAENLTATRICLVLAFIGGNVIQYNVAFGQQNIRLHWSMVDLLGCLTQLAIAAGMCGYDSTMETAAENNTTSAALAAMEGDLLHAYGVSAHSGSALNVFRFARSPPNAAHDTQHANTPERKTNPCLAERQLDRPGCAHGVLHPVLHDPMPNGRGEGS